METNLLSDDRILVLKLIEGKEPSGLVDKTLVNGGNKLHAYLDKQLMLWTLRYDRGHPPQALRVHWTSFSKLLVDVTHYFQTRNIEVEHVIA